MSVKQIPRFDFTGDVEEMKDAFRGEAYTVYIDDGEILRLFLISDGKLSIKRSNDYFTWKYDAQEQIIHKNYRDEQVNKGLPEEIRNIQVIRNNFTGELASTLYFNNGMLFVRHFHSNLLFPTYDSNGNMNNENMKKHLGLTEETTNRPIFLVGNIPESIRATKLRELNNGVKEADSELFIHFPYGKDMLEKFDERFEVDVNTQVFADTGKEGLIRIFYKDSFDNLSGIILNALNSPDLEVMKKFKDS